MRFWLVVIVGLAFPALAIGQNSVQVGPAQVGTPTLRSVGLTVPIISGDANANAAASIRYRVQGAATWQVGFPLLRVRPELADISRSPELTGSLILLQEGTTYEIEINVTDPDGGGGIQTITAQTRSLPPADPQTPRIVPVSTSSALSSALAASQPGDVITLAPGTYTGDFGNTRDGTVNNPIIVRGAARDAVIIVATADFGFQIRGDYTTLEDVTIQAPTGVRTHSCTGTVIRRCRMRTVDIGINAGAYTNRLFTFYDNVLEGDNVWPAIDNSTWDDEGIALTGQGHAVFHNTLSGFGDALGLKQETDIPTRDVDFYNNDVLFTGDDGMELDDGERNIRAWENRITNSATLVSIQHNYDTGGPIYAFRNVGVNQARRPFKLNDGPSGFFLFHNTCARTFGENSWLWTQYNNGDIDNFQIKNNLLVWLGAATGKIIAFEAPTHFADYDYNGYYPDGDFWLGPAGSYTSLAEAQADGSPYDAHGRIVSQPIFATTISLGPDYTTLVQPQNVALAAGSDAVDAGVVIPGINGNYQGSAPDLGAYEQGVPPPLYGARLFVDQIAPAAPSNLIAR